MLILRFVKVFAMTRVCVFGLIFIFCVTLGANIT